MRFEYLQSLIRIAPMRSGSQASRQINVDDFVRIADARMLRREVNPLARRITGLFLQLALSGDQMILVRVPAGSSMNTCRSG